MIDTEVKLSAGSIRGAARDERGVRAFLGIPYASPPLGADRWRSPRPAEPWPGVFDATCFGPSAPTALPGENTQSENCLRINVWTAAASIDQRLPVMVWIPGGGFQESDSARPNIDGATLAGRGVVVVSFNYRAGVLGFLAHSELDAEGEASGNFGLQDQILALQWVQENIGAFGGDPGKVTIFGESAGAVSVALLTASPIAQGLFHRAIGQSGGYWESIHGSMPTASEARDRGAGLLESLGVATIEEARSIPVEQLMRVAGWMPPKDPLRHSFSPSVDGFVLPEHPMTIFTAGRQNDVPLLAGWNSHEGETFLPFEPRLHGPGGLQAAIDLLFGERRSEGHAAYPSRSAEQARSSALALAGDLYVGEATWSWLGDRRRSGTAPAYAYHFDVATDYTPSSRHAVEIDYVFGTLAPHWLSPPSGEPSARDRELAAQLGAYWVNFARTGDPNGEGLPHWPEYQPEAERFLVFGTEATAASGGPSTDRLHLLRSLRGPDHRRPQSWRCPAAG